jgi:microcystin-dependent protein
MADPFVAEIRMFPFNFAPTGWAFCDGQILPISQNTALFSLLGTVYGGDGKSTFALPDLQGSVPLHAGNNQPGPGLSIYDLGQIGGAQFVTLLNSEMPFHTHQMRAYTLDNADSKFVSASASFAPSTGGNVYQTAGNTTLSPQALAPAGGDLPHNNLMPYLTVNFCIALQGVFPPRG